MEKTENDVVPALENEEAPAKRQCIRCSDVEKQEKEDIKEKDSSYFKSYEHIGIHEEMIRDVVRTNSYRLAILRASESLIGKAVADVGAGTGVLSCFCVQAGARKVYAIEASSIAKQAEKVAEANGASNKINVIQDRVENIELPEKVDAIVSEWMGHFLLYESMLNSVILARDKWLKKDGLILPNKANLYLAPFTNVSFYCERIGFWSTVKERFGVDMSCLESEARKIFCSDVHIEIVDDSDLLARESLISELDLETLTQDDLESIKSPFRFSCFGRQTLCGFTAWFTVTFDTRVKGKESLSLSTSPDEPYTHWRQCCMYLDKPVDVEQDTIIAGTITLTPGKQNRRFLNIELTYQVDEGEAVTKHYSLTDGSS
ncbi:protein arginine N-methyltransferase 6 [Strongylocentrotus purpuratus]|uniref:Protein arginine N-methyltransferase 6 n=1 Tax=Strongylocentrotus purpuratus TaxID=7668 RepID=A0A7M7SSV0_STRPU|nr:protein arginine N-methyltransferase 6 [Strongylocentrotus purpuratus]